MNKTVKIKDLGQIDYKEAWSIQEELFKEIISIKKINKFENLEKDTQNFLLICEHNPVYTIGKTSKNSFNNINYINKIPVYHINRGGDITFHGPEQLVLYPILNLDYFFKDINLYLRSLEQIVIRTLANFKIDSTQIDKLTGVWTHHNNEYKKICSIGIRTSYWTTMHGLALNVNTDLEYFDYIDPCGLVDKKVTSMEKILGKKLDKEKVKNALIDNFIKVFKAPTNNSLIKL